MAKELKEGRKEEEFFATPCCPKAVAGHGDRYVRAKEEARMLYDEGYDADWNISKKKPKRKKMDRARMVE